MGNIDWREVLNWSEEQMDELRLTAYSYIRQGKYDIALPFFETLVVVDGAKPYNWQTLGALYLETSDGEKAVKTLKTALEMDPKHPPTQLNYCKGLFLVGDLEGGLAEAQKLKKHPMRRISSFARALLLAYS